MGSEARKSWDVLGFGAIAVDELLFVKQYPQIDEKVPVLRKERHGGGNAATALVAVSRLGGRAAYCGVLGDDELSRFSLHELEQEGVDTSPTFHKPDARPFTATVIVDMSQAKRSILFSGEGVVEPDPLDVTDELITSSKVLFVDHQATGIGLHVARLAKKNQIPLIGDFEGALHPRLLELVNMTDHLIVGIDFGRKVAGVTDINNVLRKLANRDRACCVVTAGEKGCWYCEYGGEIHHFPAYRVQVVDTTGCGDVFHGAYAAGLARGDSLEVRIRFATAAAALMAMRGAIPHRAALEAFLDEEARAATAPRASARKDPGPPTRPMSSQHQPSSANP